jgi:histone acetyltransferase (RNA polymerase elongator complex component)
VAIAADHGAPRLFVTAAVGSRPYYTALGFEPVGPYLAKPLCA